MTTKSLLGRKLPDASVLQSDLLEGMYVRVPNEFNPIQGEFRDFCIGRVVERDEIADTVTVQLANLDFDGDVELTEATYPRTWVHRCRILPDTKFAFEDRESGGVIVIACEDDFSPGAYVRYFVSTCGKTQVVEEKAILVASHRGDPDPRWQMATYELQNPTFRSPRDSLVACYSELQAATFGIESLVGSRIMLLAHQAETIATILNDVECRYVLADEVGLGKTIEAAVILKAMQRRHPKLSTLIIVPSSLLAQWYFELDHKFWMRFVRGDKEYDFENTSLAPGYILSTEQLITNPALARWAKEQPWDFLIVDEAHNVSRNSELADYVSGLSATVAHVLLLSATPVQRRSTEYLDLLKLLHPARYASISPEQFSDMLQAQLELMKIVARVAPDLNAEFFDPDDFASEMDNALTILCHDNQLSQKVANVRHESADRSMALEAAKEMLAYISENYRLERRVIRNRRANLQIDLPVREVTDEFSYEATSIEMTALDELHEYADYLLQLHRNSDYAREMVRLLFTAALSSPHALLSLLNLRQALLTGEKDGRRSDVEFHLVSNSAPREEPGRIERLLSVIPEGPDEAPYLSRLLWQTQQWHQATVEVLEALPFRQHIPPARSRLTQVLHAVDYYCRKSPKVRIVIFAGWIQTVQALLPVLRKHLGREKVFQFHINLEESELQDQVVGFQESPGQAVLICDELGGEGRNFQIADLIIHVDLPWTPAKVEQRIGRVDRLGRKGTVLSVVPFVRNQIEEDLYRILQDALDLFTRSMSGMEIVLEGIQNELLASLDNGTRDGFRNLLPEMTARAKSLRDQVEEERYYEGHAINSRRRDEFGRISERYKDGRVLRGPVLSWADQAGLKNGVFEHSDTVAFYPRDFNLQSISNAKFRAFPNMEEASERSRRANSLRIEGTFNRSVAVTREDLVFFAPGSDPWTDAIIRNALEADRGRSCGIMRSVPQLAEAHLIFELTYRIQVNPRPLLALGYDPIHLLRAQGYIAEPIHRLFLLPTGELLPLRHPFVQAIQTPYWSGRDVHLGKRGGEHPPIRWFKSELPEEHWTAMLQDVFTAAELQLKQEYDFVADLAVEAMELFGQISSGLRASIEWYASQQLPNRGPETTRIVDEYEEISDALVAGLADPLFTLESACCWILRPSAN